MMRQMPFQRLFHEQSNNHKSHLGHKMPLNLTPLSKAAISLNEAVTNACDDDFINSLTKSQKNLITAGVIQNFEFTYELSWKFIKRWLSANIGNTHVEGVTRRELFRLAASSKLIDDVKTWMYYHQARNQTYDEATAKEAFNVSITFSLEAKKLLTVLEAKND